MEASDGEAEPIIIDDYEVNVPQVPATELKRRKDEKKFADELYEGRH